MGGRRHRGNVTGSHASYFGPRRFDVDLDQPEEMICAWAACTAEKALGTPVCMGHASIVAKRFLNFARPPIPDHAYERKVPPGQAYVYYLMLSPSMVKIGTTVNLTRRLIDLRSELQYVVALERGHFNLEKQRHAEFAAERIGRREDFVLSPALKEHISSIAQFRDEIVAEATRGPAIGALDLQ